jgi:hypothetical protein
VWGSEAGAIGAGLGASLAIVTRPNLVPLAAVIGLFFVVQVVRAPGERRRWLCLVLFVAATIPGCVAVAAINQHLYGSALRSGYESLDALYAWSNSGPNLDRYPRWLMQTQTPFIGLAVAALWFARARGSHTKAPLDPSLVGLLLTFAAVVCLSYVFYRPFGRDEWTYLRFLLPAYPVLLVLAVAVTIEVAKRAIGPGTAATSIAVIICVALSGWQARESVRRGALTARVSERRYLDVGRYIEATLPRNSVFIARLHAGSIRYYSGRLTMNYDWLERRWLDDAIGELTTRGYRPFIVVEQDEEPGFRERFAELNTLGELDWPPMAERTETVRVRIYDPVDRERFRQGEHIDTRPIGRAAFFR